MIRKKTSALLLLLGVSSTYPALLLADDVNCSRSLGNVSIDGNVLIAGACRLDGTTVRGNVLLYAGGSLIARSANIIGSIQADTADFVDVESSRVNGNIQLDKMVGDVSTIYDNRVGGSIQLKDNRSALEVGGNNLDGDVQVFDNSGGVLIVGNAINGNLQCKSNAPAPAGGDNRVGGNREDQCARLLGDVSVPRSAGSGSAGSGSSGGGGGSFALLGAGILLLLATARGLRRRGAG